AGELTGRGGEGHLVEGADGGAAAPVHLRDAGQADRRRLRYRRRGHGLPRTYRRLVGRREDRVERGQVEDPVQVDRLEQPDRGGLLRVLGQRRRVRVVGEGDLLKRRADHLGRQRLAGVGGELVVGVRLRLRRVGLD